MTCADRAKNARNVERQRRRRQRTTDDFLKRGNRRVVFLGAAGIRGQR
jgi:hypothetical protein